MLDPQYIIDQIEDDLRIGCLTVGMFIDVAVMPDNYGPYVKHRFVSCKEELVTFLFDLSLSRKILAFERVRNPNEISVNGYDDAVVGYELHVVKLASLFDMDELKKFGWLTDEDVQDWKTFLYEPLGQFETDGV